jgi:hypothetical protein
MRPSDRPGEKLRRSVLRFRQVGRDAATRYRTAPARPAVRYRRVRARVAVALAAVTCVPGLALGACTGDGGDDRAGASSTTVPTPADTTPEPLAVGEIPAPGAGQARLVLGAILDVTLDLTACTRDLDARPDGEVPSEQVVIDATGDADGTPVALSVRRYRSQGASPTITDTIRVTQGPVDTPTAVHEAQRFEVDGLVTDPRDADADDPLLRITREGIEATALFAPPGAFADDGGLVEGALAITCGG